MRKTSSCLLLIVLAIASIGTTTILAGEKALLARRPRVWVEYFPFYETHELPVEFRPLPTYSGWTKERMVRDLQRLVENNLDGTVLCITPQDLADSYKRTRIKEFLELSQSSARTALLCLTADHPMQLDLGNTERFLKHQGIAEQISLYRQEQKIIIAFAQNIQLTGTDEKEFSHRVLGRDWHALPCPADAVGISTTDNLVWIYTSYHEPTKTSWPIQEWKLPRDGFKHFRKALEKSRELSPKIIVISSWNDWYNGSALEKSTLEGDKGLEVLRAQMEKWK